MPAVAELSFLLFAFINSIHAEEPIIILEEKDFYAIKLPDEGDLCLISRYVGEQKLVLWNTSDVWSTNTTLPEDLKDQHVFVDRLNISSYTIDSLTHSDSGLYQVECWTNGTMTQSENISLTVCSGKHKRRRVQVSFGETVDLLCEGAADNLSVQWLKYHYGGQKKDKWTRVFTDSKNSLSDNEEDRLQVVKGTSTLRVSNFNLEVFGPYTCLVMDKQCCIGSHPVAVVIQSEFLYRSAGETAVLHCVVGNSNDDQPLHWIDPSFKIIPLKSPQSSDSFNNFTEHQQNASSVNPEVNQNNSLVFSSVSVSDAGTYICMRSFSWTSYILVVCPEFGPPAVEHFSQGDVVTLGCNHSLGVKPFWFMKKDQVEELTCFSSTPQLLCPLR
ncbi:titin-like isoform X1 [Lates japonicus]|uniref:Titin-like isoform X1 n=1 Tax=Lates japonicus TaxID=270547 RepID=A0AAD3N5B0_LATJO|nr:titin-like isoform X1 [Lates japonicus]